SEEISLVILDVVMPKMSGREVCERIKGIKPDTRVLYVSAFSPNSEHTDFISKNGMELLQKPIDPHDLLCKIRSVLDGP
ncbi:MAG: response regulator, partial [Planctomycetes bacterium]|nr:response regulator [Planctomycetota bacterium]